MACKPVMNGVLWNLGKTAFHTEEQNYTWSAAQWRADFDAMRHIGLKKFMIFTGVPQGMSRPAAAAPDIIEFIAGECDRCGMELIIATGGHPGWYRDLKMPDEMTLVRRYVDEICRRYADHPSFAGWYIDYEFSLRYNEQAALRELYREIVILCKEKTPGLPVITSPFFNPPTATDIMQCGIHPPEEYYDFWSDMLAYSHPDVLALQDNGGQHLSFFDASVTAPYIAAYAQACKDNNCRFWGNVETGEFLTGSAEEFTEKHGEEGNVNLLPDFWRSVPIDRLQSKLELMSQYSECNLSWGYQPFYRPSMGEKAAKAYHDYEEYLRKNFPEMLVD